MRDWSGFQAMLRLIFLSVPLVRPMWFDTSLRPFQSEPSLFGPTRKGPLSVPFALAFANGAKSTFCMYGFVSWVLLERKTPHREAMKLNLPF